jgi:EpsI family protein
VRKSFADFPETLGDWRSAGDQKIDRDSMKILQVDDYIMRSYQNSEGDTISLYIGFFNCQVEGKGIHSPRQCLPGAGWSAVSSSVYQMPARNHNSEEVPVNKFVMQKGGERQLYIFWYHGRGRIYASEYWNKIYLIWDGLTKRRTDGALIRINSSVEGNNDDAFKKQIEFIKLLFPMLEEYIPE